MYLCVFGKLCFVHEVFSFFLSARGNDDGQSQVCFCISNTLIIHDVSAANKASPKGRLCLGCLNDMRGSRVALFHRPHAEMGMHRTDAIHTHTAAKRSEMVKEPVSTLDARWVQAQPGVKLLTRTKTVGSPISSQRSSSYAEPSASPHSSSWFCRGCQTSRTSIHTEREMERERPLLRHRWAAGMNPRPDAKRTFGDSKQTALEPSGGYSGLVHLYQSLGVINLLSSPMRTCHRPPNGICLRPNSSGGVYLLLSHPHVRQIAHRFPFLLA
ncbi:hypothetical protein V8C26DRAFT_260350 [Trichoderma gracile]